MKKFAVLFENLEQSKSDVSKINFLKDCFLSVADSDKMWAIYFLSGKKIKRQISSAKLKEFALEFSEISEWLFDESHKITGDVLETLTLILPPPSRPTEYSFSNWIDFIFQLESLTEIEKKQSLFDAWNQLHPQERFVFNKLVTGGFRSPITIMDLVKSLTEVLKLEESNLTVKLSEKWSPHELNFKELFKLSGTEDLISKPFPFSVIELFDGDISTLGNPQQWYSELRFGGIRSHLIFRKNKIFIWSENGELQTRYLQSFEQIKKQNSKDFVVEGEFLKVENKNVISTRTGKKTTPNVSEQQFLFSVSDILEFEGNDLREKAFSERRSILEKVISDLNLPELLQPSPQIDFQNWADLNLKRMTARDSYADHLILRKIDKSEKQLKWKPDLLSIYAVLIYAQKDESKPTNFFNLFSFGVWNSAGVLVPIAKTGFGLNDLEMKEIDFFIKNNIVEKFGPVRTVKPKLVFEIGFEGISQSSRHKSGLMLHSPIILNWQKNRDPEDSGTLEKLKQFLR